MTILLAIITALLAILAAVAIRYFDRKLIATDQRLEKLVTIHNVNVQNIMSHIQANTNRALNNADMIEKNAEAILVISNDFQDHNNDINMICAKLESIVQDIHRLDEDISKVSADEKEIRSYYVNYRDPQVPNGGVPWAKDMKVGEDNE